MSQTITLRVADQVADWLKSWARRSGRSVNDIGAMLLEEAKRVSDFANIEFNTFAGERHACVKGYLQVWQAIEVAQRLDMNPERLAEYFDWPVWRAQSALNYYEAFPAEIDVAITENQSVGYEKLKRMFPHMTLTEVNFANPNDLPDSRAADLAAESSGEYTMDVEKARAS